MGSRESITSPAPVRTGEGWAEGTAGPWAGLWHTRGGSEPLPEPASPTLPAWVPVASGAFSRGLSLVAAHRGHKPAPLAASCGCTDTPGSWASIRPVLGSRCQTASLRGVAAPPPQEGTRAATAPSLPIHQGDLAEQPPGGRRPGDRQAPWREPRGQHRPRPPPGHHSATAPTWLTTQPPHLPRWTMVLSHTPSYPRGDPDCHPRVLSPFP